MFFKWLSKKGFLVLSPARHLKLPSVNQALPKYVFSTADIEQVMGVPDVSTATGLRDRATDWIARYIEVSRWKFLKHGERILVNNEILIKHTKVLINGLNCC
ncbi:MAG: hypothetical protein ACI9N9_002871 [Enterobacterales bacterium]|jgi:hypothetical protein